MHTRSKIIETIFSLYALNLLEDSKRILRLISEFLLLSFEPKKFHKKLFFNEN